MTAKGTKELLKTGKSRLLSPFEEMEHWFEDAWKRPFSLFHRPFWPELKLTDLDEISPSVDIFEEEKHIVVKADIPGLEKKDLSVDLTDGVLTISGEKKKEDNVEKKNYHRYERSYGSFSRSFRVPEGIDTGKIKAHYKDGVVEVQLPKTEETVKKTKKISVE